MITLNQLCLLIQLSIIKIIYIFYNIVSTFSSFFCLFHKKPDQYSETFIDINNDVIPLSTIPVPITETQKNISDFDNINSDFSYRFYFFLI
jgi:hypothetical protein